MEIVDRIKASQKEYTSFYHSSLLYIIRCKIATDHLLKILKMKNLARVKLALEITEVLSKNGNLYYHKLLC